MEGLCIAAARDEGDRVDMACSLRSCHDFRPRQRSSLVDGSTRIAERREAALDMGHGDEAHFAERFRR